MYFVLNSDDFCHIQVRLMPKLTNLKTTTPRFSYTIRHRTSPDTGEPIMLDPKQRLRSHRELQREAIRMASTYAHFSQDQPFYLNKAVNTPFSAYEWAVADYFGKPRVLGIDIGQWTGGAGQAIRIQASDNLMVLRVSLAIRETFYVMEEGDAVQSRTEPSIWTYTTRTPLQPGPGVWLSAAAYDLPGHKGENFLVVK
jgi:hypothetical protein